MSVQSGQSVTVLFTTRVAATAVGTNADSLPTGTLYVNGTANGATVTVTNISTGLYKAQVTLPTLAIADEVEMVISATVSAVADSAVIWGDVKDFAADASGYVTANLNGDLTATMKTSVATAVHTTAMTESYAAAGGTMTPAQALYQLVQQRGNASVTGTTEKVLKRDGVTTAKTFTLNSATSPTSIVEAT